MDEKTRTLESHMMPRKGDMLTLNIPPPIEMQHFRNGKITQPYHDRKQAFVTEWYNLFKKYLDPACRYDMYLEISRYGLLHWHGTVKIKDPELFNHAMGVFKHLLHIQRLEVDTIEDLTFRKKYQSKDQKIMKIRLENRTKLKPSILDFLGQPPE